MASGFSELRDVAITNGVSISEMSEENKLVALLVFFSSLFTFEVHQYTFAGIDVLGKSFELLGLQFSVGFFLSLAGMVYAILAFRPKFMEMISNVAPAVVTGISFGTLVLYFFWGEFATFIHSQYLYGFGASVVVLLGYLMMFKYNSINDSSVIQKFNPF